MHCGSVRHFVPRLLVAALSCAVLGAGLTLRGEAADGAPSLERPSRFVIRPDTSRPAVTDTLYDPHAAVFAESEYPSANQCAACHQEIYDEWSSSSHAYSSMSPMFHKFEQRINNLSSGTIGYFCMRCHNSVGTTLGESRDLPLWERSQVSREGVTCITCHRVDQNYGRVNGERRIEPGDIHASVVGSGTGQGVAEVAGSPERFRVRTGPGGTGPGLDMHARAIQFEQVGRSEFCVSCHQVAVHPGIKLEVVWDQYRASPAAKQNISCHDCHMGKTPGVPDGYATGPAAVVAGVPINPQRRRTNHTFYGPGYAAAHPGIFPHNPKAERWSVDQWLSFDYRAGWGTAEFENRLPADARSRFPAVWADADDRMDAREIIEENLAKLEKKKDLRRQVMENGSRIDGPFFSGEPRVGQGLSFSYTITNTNSGHNLPSGSLGAQPELWVNVALIDPDGNRIWESGYVDRNGDMADLHSTEVLNGRIAHDRQLFNLQTKFLTTNVKGTDREMYLPINIDIDQLPFIRPPTQPVTVMNHPPFIRMEGRSLPPLSARDARYSVPGSLITKPGTYKLAVRMRSRAQPIYFMRFVGATEEMERAMNEWMIDIHPYTVEFVVR